MAALGIGAFIVALILVIVIHEAAHFAVARAFGIKVTEFFVGFGPKLWSRMRGETEVGVQGDRGRRLREDRRDEPVRDDRARGLSEDVRR